MYFHFYAPCISCCNSKKRLKSVYIYGSYRKIKTGVPVVVVGLIQWTEKYPTSYRTDTFVPSYVNFCMYYVKTR